MDLSKGLSYVGKALFLQEENMIKRQLGMGMTPGNCLSFVIALIFLVIIMLVMIATGIIRIRH